MLKRTMNLLVCYLLGHEVAWIKQKSGALPVLGCTRCHCRLNGAGGSSPLRAQQ